MGPAFNALIVLVLGAIATTVCFIGARFFFPPRDAAMLALLLVASGGMGCAAGLLLQIPFTPENLESGGAVLRYLGSGLVVGVLAAAVALRLFLRLRSKRAAEPESKKAAP